MNRAFLFFLLAALVALAHAAPAEPTLTRDKDDGRLATYTLKNTTAEALFLSPICVLETFQNDRWVAGRPVPWNEQPDKQPDTKPLAIPAGGAVQLTSVVISGGLYPWRATAFLMRTAEDKEPAFTVRTDKIPERPPPK